MSLKDKITISKYKKALQSFSEVYNNAPLKKRHVFLYPIRNAGISRRDAENLGFNVNGHSWKGCLNRNIRHEGQYF